MLVQAIALMLVASPIENGNAVSPPQAGSALLAHFVQEKPVTFRAWAARSSLATSLDGRSLFFFENGPDGLVLKSADLSTGAVSVRAHVTGDYHNVATIPNDPDHLLLGEAGMWSNPAFRVVLLDLKTGGEKDLDIGDRGDGELLVSPSGRYVVTGVNYFCHTGDRDCFADYRAIISLATGKQEYQFKRPVRKDKGFEPIGEEGAPVEVTRTTPLGVDISWAEGDTLVLTPARAEGFKETVLQRDANGHWRTTAITPTRVVRREVQKLYSGMNSISLARSPGAAAVKIDPAALFGPGLGRISAYPLDDRVLVIKESPPDKGGWELVEVVSLKWKDAANTK